MAVPCEVCNVRDDKQPIDTQRERTFVNVKVVYSYLNIHTHFIRLKLLPWYFNVEKIPVQNYSLSEGQPAGITATYDNV